MWRILRITADSLDLYIKEAPPLDPIFGHDQRLPA